MVMRLPTERQRSSVITRPTLDPLWYKDAIIYQVHVRTFRDSNGDGIGDFRGLTERLDYIRDLGVTAIWLQPFYPSPLRDDGYDIASYREVHPHYGTLADFKHFLREAHRRGLQVITELVINHTSDQHPWFQAARRAPAGSVKRDYYVWSDDDRKWPETRIIFTDTEQSNWTWDPVARAYYWHRFFSHQPDLNFDNPHVLMAVVKVMRFWFDMGVDGMRLDAIPYLKERDGTNNENLPETHEVLKLLRAELDARYSDRFFLAEANQWPEDVREYFGDGDECHVAYHFPLMPRMYMAIAQEDRHPIIEIMQQTPDIPANCQWAIFLRNHDELTLEMVTSRERDYMYRMYAADPRARINLGIRRRLAPLLENDGDKIRLMISLLLSMPGSPIIYYGDELGMGDNVYLGDRNAVRTPMQWSPDRNGGFSTADPQRLYLPTVMDPVYGYQAVNVEAQQREPSSLLNWMRRILSVRKRHVAFGRGSLTFLRAGNHKVLAYLRSWRRGDDASDSAATADGQVMTEAADGSASLHDAATGAGAAASFEAENILCVANLSRTPQPVELDLARFKGLVPVELSGQTAFPPIGDLPYLLTLPGHGFYWFHLSPSDAAPPWHQEWLGKEEAPILVMLDGWRTFTGDAGTSNRRRDLALAARGRLERELVPAFLKGQRWYAVPSAQPGTAEDLAAPHGSAATQAASLNARLAWQVEFPTATGPALLAAFEVTLPGASRTDRYFVPLAQNWDDEGENTRLPSATILAKIRQQAKVGLLVDAMADDAFCRALVHAIAGQQTISHAGGAISFRASEALPAVFELLASAPATSGDLNQLTVRHPPAQSSNTTAIIGDRLFLKAYRLLGDGISVEIEVGRFLTEIARYRHAVPILGTVEHTATDGTRTALAVLQTVIQNQGDGWTLAVEYLERLIESETTGAPTQPAAPGDQAEPSIHGLFIELGHTLGKRTAELHLALATPSGDPAFEPEPLGAGDLAAWGQRVRKERNATLEQLMAVRGALAESLQPLIDTVLTSINAMEEVITRVADLAPAGQKIRHHGDFHLGQVLLSNYDFYIIDFEGEPARPLAERRQKHSPLRDVAGLIRSIDYAGSNALARHRTSGHGDPEQARAVVALWKREVVESYVGAYAQTIGEAPLYGDWADALVLLDLFILEKTLYELRYELAHRPDWVAIPLEGLVERYGGPR